MASSTNGNGNDNGTGNGGDDSPAVTFKFSVGSTRSHGTEIIDEKGNVVALVVATDHRAIVAQLLAASPDLLYGVGRARTYFREIAHAADDQAQVIRRLLREIYRMATTIK